MKITVFSLIITVILIFSIGCNAENPVCSTNFCAIGEVFPRSELDDNQPYSEVDIDDSVIFATLIGGTRAVETIQPPAKPTPADSVTLADIVENTANSDSDYEGHVHTLTGTVKKILGDGDSLTVESGNDIITFFVLAWGRPEAFTDHEVGTSYDFQVYIHDQAPSISTDGGYVVWAYLVFNTEPQGVTADTLNTHAKAENQQYQGSVITLTATISTVLDSVFFLRDNEIGVALMIRRSGHSAESQYQKGQSYTFTAVVLKIGASFIGSEVRLGLIHE